MRFDLLFDPDMMGFMHVCLKIEVVLLMLLTLNWIRR